MAFKIQTESYDLASKRVQVNLYDQDEQKSVGLSFQLPDAPNETQEQLEQRAKEAAKSVLLAAAAVL